MKYLLAFCFFFNSLFLYSQTIPLQQKGKWGLRTGKNDFISYTPFVYDDVQPWDEYSGCLKRGDKWAIYKNDRISPAIFDKMPRQRKGDNFHTFEAHKKLGLMNDTFAIVCPAKYDSIGTFSRIGLDSRGFESDTYIEGLQVDFTTLDAFALVKNKQKYGLIMQNGKELLPCKYPKIIYLHQIVRFYQEQNNGFYAIGNNKKQFALYSPLKQFLTPFVYDKISNNRISAAYFIVQKDQKLGLIDTLGKTILPCEYDDMRIWADTLFYVATNEGYGLKNHQGKEILPCKFDEIELQIHPYNTIYPLTFLTKKGKVLQEFTEKGEILVPQTENKGKEEGKDSVEYYGWDYTVESHQYIIRKNTKYGVRDSITHRQILPYIYDDIVGMGKGYWASKKGIWYRFDVNGTQVKGIEYERFERVPATRGLCIVGKKKLYGIYNLVAENEVMPCSYSELYFEALGANASLFSYAVDSLEAKVGFVLLPYDEKLDYIVSPCQFDDFQLLFYRLSLPMTGGSVGVYTGPSSYTPSFVEPYIKVQQNGKDWRVWNLQTHQYAHDFSAVIVEDDEVNYLMRTQKGFQMYRFDSLARFTATDVWEDYKRNNKNNFWVKWKGKWQIYNATEMKYIPQFGEYDELTEVGKCYLVRKNQKYGLLGKDLHPIIPCNKNALSVRQISEGFLEVLEGTKKYYLEP